MIKKATSLLLFMLTAGFLSAQSNWSKVGPSFDASVQTLLSDTTANTLYAGGSFTQAGTLSRLGIAKWDGAHWYPLGGGMVTGTAVKTLGFYGGNLVAAGTFSQLDTTSCSNIGVWNGTKWSALGNGVQKYTGATTVSTQIVFGGDLYVAGTFDHSGATTLSNIAKWNGSSWSSVGTGINGPVTKLVVFSGELYACGTFSSAGGVTVHNIARWNGTGWADVGGGVQKYTGATTVSTMLNFAQALYVGGDFDSAGGNAVNHLAKWDGTTWTDAGTGLNYTGATTVSTQFMGAYSNCLIASINYVNTATSASVYRMASFKNNVWSISYTMDAPFTSLESLNGTLCVGGTFTYMGTDTVPFLTQLLESNRKSLFAAEALTADYSYILYPNPAENDVWIKTDNTNTDDVMYFTMMDLTGREVMHVNNITTDNMHISRNGLAAGMYIYRITGKGDTLIKQGKLTFK